jgi:hypothetical protein
LIAKGLCSLLRSPSMPTPSLQSAVVYDAAREPGAIDRAMAANGRVLMSVFWDASALAHVCIPGQITRTARNLFARMSSPFGGARRLRCAAY